MKIAIMADIHANKPAFDAVMEDVKKNNCEHICVLGDLIGYYHWPKYIVEQLMNNPKFTVIRGNHEDLLKNSILDSSFRSECYKKYGSGFNICMENLSKEQLLWLELLPKSAEVCIDDIHIGLFHGSEKETDEYIYPDAPSSRIKAIQVKKFDFIFFGHTHYPVTFTKNNTLIANPGSVGQPRDVGSLSSYIILNTKNTSLSFKRVPFNSKAVREKVLEHDPNYDYLVKILKRNNPYA